MGKKRITAWMGIDPGKGGAVCVLTKKLNIKVFDWNDDENVMIETLGLIVHRYDIRMCVIEDIHPMFKVGAKTTWGMGYNLGQWDMLLAMYDIPHIKVSPKEWQKEAKVKIKPKASPKERKMATKKVCLKMFPNGFTKLLGPNGAYKDGRGDALLMGYVAKQRG